MTEENKRELKEFNKEVEKFIDELGQEATAEGCIRCIEMEDGVYSFTYVSEEMYASILSTLMQGNPELFIYAVDELIEEWETEQNQPLN